MMTFQQIKNILNDNRPESVEELAQEAAQLTTPAISDERSASTALCIYPISARAIAPIAVLTAKIKYNA